MAVTIFPTENDVAATRGGGIFGTEARISAALGAAWRRGVIISGLQASILNEANFTMSVAAGSAFINGYLYMSDAAQTVTVNASETNAVWYLQLVRDSATNDVQGVEWVRVVGPGGSDDDPEDSCRVFSTTTTAAQITNFKWERSVGRFYSYSSAFGIVIGSSHGKYTGDGNTGRQIDLGFRPIFVIVMGDMATGNRSEIIGLSAAGQSGTSVVGMYIDSLGFGTSTEHGKRPAMNQYGFYVGSIGDEGFDVSSWVDNLNQFGREYRYIAFS